MQARLLHLDQVRIPPTQEIASENVFLVPRSLGIGDIDAAAILDLILKADALLVCPCALADNRRACLRQQWVSRLSVPAACHGSRASISCRSFSFMANLVRFLSP